MQSASKWKIAGNVYASCSLPGGYSYSLHVLTSTHAWQHPLCLKGFAARPLASNPFRVDVNSNQAVDLGTFYLAGIVVFEPSQKAFDGCPRLALGESNSVAHENAIQFRCRSQNS
jgi:hypothetical protein